MIQKLRELPFKGAIVPEDAVDLNFTTLDFGDASKSIICASICVRFGKKDGTFSCQLVLARTKVVPQGMSLPRGELSQGITKIHGQSSVSLLDHKRQETTERMGEESCYRNIEIQHD